MTLSIYESWTKGLKRLGTIERNANSQLEASLTELNKYLYDEELLKSKFQRPEVRPKFQSWENIRLKSAISRRGIGHLWTLEFTYIKHRQFKEQQAKFAFDYGYSRIVLDIYSLHLRRLRFPETRGMPHNVSSVRYCALGILIGQEQKVLNLVKLQLHAHNNGWIGYKKYPIYNLLLNLLADYFELPRMSIPEDTNNKALVDSILNAWQTEDLTIIEPLLIELCHLHTHKVRTDNDKIRFLHEFNDRVFGYFPFEYFLISKLRAKKGLTTPKISHPLVVTEIDYDTEVDTNTHDDIYLEVINKMSKQGFNEQEVLKQTLNNEKPRGFLYKVLHNCFSN